MLIIKLTGGLGNQMFQYAFIKNQSLKNNSKFKIDKHNLGGDRPYSLGIFNIKENFATKNDIPRYENLGYSKLEFWFKWFCKHINPNHHTENYNTLIDNFFGWQMNNLEDTISKFHKIKNGYIEGLFQSELYFQKNKNTIFKDFTFKKRLSDKTKEISEIIKVTNSVGIHIRRGDYLQKYWSNLLGVKGLDYYQEAISIINDKIKNPYFFFISDDPEWCKNQFKELKNSYFIDWNNGGNDWEDMYLLSICKNNIIGNSTFAWRGAYLNRNKDKTVIAPKQWAINNDEHFKLIIPTDWYKL